MRKVGKKGVWIRGKIWKPCCKWHLLPLFPIDRVILNTQPFGSYPGWFLDWNLRVSWSNGTLKPRLQLPVWCLNGSSIMQAHIHHSKCFYRSSISKKEGTHWFLQGWHFNLTSEDFYYLTCNTKCLKLELRVKQERCKGWSTIARLTWNV